MTMSAREFKEAVRTPYAWPGGYPTALLMSDGESLCIKCAYNNAREILSEIHSPDSGDSSWQPEAHYANYEDSSLYCAQCGERIESAYAEEHAVYLATGGQLDYSEWLQAGEPKQD